MTNIELSRRHRLTIGVSLAFLLSGAGALAFEALWFHQAGLAFGNGVWASSLVLAAFMAGLAAGNALAVRFGDRLRDGLRAYAWLELAVALGGVGLVLSFPAIGDVLAPVFARFSGQPGTHNLLRLAVAFGCLLVPSTAIGMTLPILVRALRRVEPSFGRALGLLYGINTVGGVLGVIIVETWWLESLGVRGSAWAAATLDVLAAAGVLALARWTAPVAAGAPPLDGPEPDEGAQEAIDHAARDVATRDGARRWQSIPWLLVSFLSGFVVLALEVVWLRFLWLVLNDTPLAFSMLLALVLAGLSIGGLIAGFWLGRSPRAVQAAPFVALSVGALGVLGYRLYPYLLAGSLPARQGPDTIVEIAAPLVLPACVASGVLFPLLGAGLRARGDRDAATVGRLTLVNTIGAAVGSLVAGFWLLPSLGMERSMLVLFGLSGAGGVLLLLAVERALWKRVAGPAAFLAVMALFPMGAMDAEYIRIAASRWKRPADEIVNVKEGLTATVVHVVHEVDGAVLFDHIATNAYSMTTNGFMARRYMKLFVNLPVAIHPKIERALVVGFGIGNTAKALVDTPEVRRIDVVDVSTDMLEVSRKLAVPLSPHPLDDPRTHVHIEDGRHFLQMHETEYDLITGEPPPPIIAGVASLYTQEYFDLVRRRLAPGGMVSYWLPLSNITAGSARSIIAAFCNVFDDCSLWHGADLDLVLLGTRGADGPVTEARFVEQWRSPAVRAELHALGLEQPGQLGALFIGDAGFLRARTESAEPLTDDFPRRLEASASRSEGEAFLARMNDPVECRKRFDESAFVRLLFPERARRSALGFFEIQRFLGDFMSQSPTVSREARTLHLVLRSSELELPVLLLMGSSPDYQAALDRLGPNDPKTAGWRRHRIARRLAQRDLAGALELVRGALPGDLVIPDLERYLAYAVQRSRR